MAELTESDAGTESSVNVGDELVVRLQENRTTGYRWQLSAPSGGLTVQDDAYEPEPLGLVGAGGVRTFRLRAVEAGKYLVNVAKRRSWENLPGDLPHLTFTIHVRP